MANQRILCIKTAGSTTLSLKRLSPLILRTSLLDRVAALPLLHNLKPLFISLEIKRQRPSDRQDRHAPLLERLEALGGCGSAFVNAINLDATRDGQHMG
jgi:hypothetical protein